MGRASNRIVRSPSPGSSRSGRDPTWTCYCDRHAFGRPELQFRRGLSGVKSPAGDQCHSTRQGGDLAMAPNKQVAMGIGRCVLAAGLGACRLTNGTSTRIAVNTELPRRRSFAWRNRTVVASRWRRRRRSHPSRRVDPAGSPTLYEGAGAGRQCRRHRVHPEPWCRTAADGWKRRI